MKRGTRPRNAEVDLVALKTNKVASQPSFERLDQKLSVWHSLPFQVIPELRVDLEKARKRRRGERLSQ